MNFLCLKKWKIIVCEILIIFYFIINSIFFAYFVCLWFSPHPIVYLADFWIHGMYVCVIRCGFVQKFHILIERLKGDWKCLSIKSHIWKGRGKIFPYIKCFVCICFCLAIVMNFLLLSRCIQKLIGLFSFDRPVWCDTVYHIYLIIIYKKL